MIKRAFLALAFLAGLLSPAFAAGTISLSLMQQFGTDNKPLNGGKLYFYAAGTTTPQNAFQDSGLTIPWPNPITLDATGRVPQLFFADGQIKVRLTNAAGVVQLAADNLLVVGPSGGGGGGGSVDPTTVLATGDLKPRFGTGNLVGFVRTNGRTIGSATSGATERANADTQALFEYLWTAGPNLVVSTGRSVSANADWTANKTIALPDWSGRALVGLDDMGAGPRGVLTATYFLSDPTVLGAAGGSQSTQLLAPSLPPHTHSGVTAGIAGHRHQTAVLQSGGNDILDATTSIFAARSAGGATDYDLRGSSGNASAAVGPTSIAGGDGGRSFTTNGGDGLTSTPFSNLTPSMLATIYLKL